MGTKRLLEGRLSQRWARFEQRIFDVSELMRSINAAFTRWYNKQNHRRGSFPSRLQRLVVFFGRYLGVNPPRLYSSAGSRLTSLTKDKRKPWKAGGMFMAVSQIGVRKRSLL